MIFPAFRGGHLPAAAATALASISRQDKIAHLQTPAWLHLSLARTLSHGHSYLQEN